MCESVTAAALTDRENMIVFSLHATLFQQQSADGLKTQANQTEMNVTAMVLRLRSDAHTALTSSSSVRK